MSDNKEELINLFFLFLSSLKIVKNNKSEKIFKRSLKLKLKFSKIKKFSNLNRIIPIYQIRK